MKKILVTSIISLIVLNMTACTKLLQLRKNISEDVISSIKVNQIPIAYDFNSEIPEKINKDSVDINFNSYFKSNLDDYMTNKFNNIKTDRNGYFISFQLKSVNLNEVADLNYAAILLDLLASKKDLGSDYALAQSDFSCKIIISVKLYQGGNLLTEKEIVSESNYPAVLKESNRYSYSYESYQKVTDMNISKSLVLINKYLASINM